MKVLVVGSGGREHAICMSVAKSSRVDKIYCAPGNAGIGEIAECVNIGAMEFDKLVAFAREKEIDLTVVAPDDPLAAGAVDAFEAAGLRAFGPRKNAAILEGSKAFSKDLMKKYGIPTAAYETFEDAKAAEEYLEKADYPIVLKADGLALGKGVLICKTKEEALAGVNINWIVKDYMRTFTASCGVVDGSEQYQEVSQRILEFFVEMNGRPFPWSMLQQAARIYAESQLGLSSEEINAAVSILSGS